MVGPKKAAGQVVVGTQWSPPVVVMLLGATSADACLVITTAPSVKVNTTLATAV